MTEQGGLEERSRDAHRGGGREGGGIGKEGQADGRGERRRKRGEIFCMN